MNYQDDYQEMIEKLHAHIDCVGVLENLGIPLTRGRQPSFLCLNHNDSHTGNCRVMSDSAVHCFACGWHADQIGIVMKAVETGLVPGTSPNVFKSACEIIAGWTGDELCWDKKKIEKREYVEPLRIHRSDLDLLGVNDTETLKKLYEVDRQEFWRYLEACTDLASEKITIAREIENNQDVLDVLEALSTQLETICSDLQEGKKKNKEKTPLFIK